MMRRSAGVADGVIARQACYTKVMARFVYFDAGGTLIHADPSVGAIYARAGAPHGLATSAEALQLAFQAAWKKHVEREGDAPIRMGKDDATTHAWWRRLV